KRDAFEGTKGRFRQVADLEPALAVLEEHHYIREQLQPEQPRRAGRKSSPVYEVNPLAPSQNSQDSQYWHQPGTLPPSHYPQNLHFANSANYAKGRAAGHYDGVAEAGWPDDLGSYPEAVTEDTPC